MQGDKLRSVKSELANLRKEVCSFGAVQSAPRAWQDAGPEREQEDKFNFAVSFPCCTFDVLEGELSAHHTKNNLLESNLLVSKIFLFTNVYMIVNFYKLWLHFRFNRKLKLLII